MRHATTKSQVKGHGAWSGAIVFFTRVEEGRFMRQSGTMLTALVVGALLAAGGWVFAQDKPAAPAASAASAAAPAPPPPSKPDPAGTADRKSTRLNSSHMSISYAVFCSQKKHN